MSAVDYDAVASQIKAMLGRTNEQLMAADDNTTREGMYLLGRADALHELWETLQNVHADRA